ncbi:conserved Plasmodium protein, unknown function [Plasmodium vinckei vinckei]|uniref:Uroporphyrinogen-III synthase n=1 Tax=Plasmodium vinckei vinckei TaxID=54757 RepID=A0A449C121_PLAVN|nr:conserved Plasmodium protein, unknown function [Plasmodium vinckei vinckei]KEG03823.1 hypothetical protein YYE_00725 [Plasmodium vinckei vinckei]VEV59382.1 conserved Plasmodium protein, unknown function [Plasmodium vinckei vinckei]
MKKRLLCWLIIFPIFSLCLKLKSKIKFLFYISSLCKQNGNNHKIKQIPFHHHIDNTNLYTHNYVNVKKNKINNPHILITSPEAAKIYRLVVILLICHLKKIIKQTSDTTKWISIKNKDNINKINKLLNIPIISIGYSTNHILNNELKKNEFYNIYKNMSLENKKIYHINSYEFNKINKNLKNFNIVFTPTISNADTLKRELSLHYFQKQKNHSIDLVWVASAISKANFENPEMWVEEKKENKNSNYNHNVKQVNATRINCYDTKGISYSKTKLKKIKINKNSIICLMSNSAVLSFYQNFGNKFNYVICMGESCYALLKKLNFINIYYPTNSKLELLLNMLVKLHHKVTKKHHKKNEKIANIKLKPNLGNTTNNNYEHENQINTQKSKYMSKQIKIVLTREKHKNFQIKKFLNKKNIPTQIIPCIKTEYKHKAITHLCNALLSHIQKGS